MKLGALIILPLLCLGSNAYSQSNLPDRQAALDSLYAVWQDETETDSVRTFAYKDYIWNGFLSSNPDTSSVLAQNLLLFGEQHHYPKANAIAYKLMGVANNRKYNYSKALEYHKRSLKILQEIGDKKLSAEGMSDIGSIYKAQNNYRAALDYYQRSLKIYEEIGDKKGCAIILGNTGTIFQEQGDYPRALEYFQRSLKIKQKIGDNQGSAITIGNIGIIYANQGHYSKALEYYERSLKISEEIGDKKRIADALTNAGSVYMDQGDYPRALESLQRSLKIYEDIVDKLGIAIVIGNIGNIYQKQRDYPKALEYYQRSLKISEEIRDNWGRAFVTASIGRIYQDQGDYSKALQYCEKALSISEEIGVLDREKDACKCLYEIYKAMGNGNEALVYLEKIQILDDSLNVDETTKKLQQMEFSKLMYADSVEQAEEARLIQEAHEDEVAKNNRTRNVLIGSGLLALLLAGGFYSRWKYVQKSRDVISKERDRSDNLLLNILPAEIAAEHKAKGRADARDFDRISILFTDFKEFTQLSEKLSAKELVGEINHCFEAFDLICEKYSVEKIKTIGDSYMAAGGLPVPNEESTKNTVLAALEMADFVITRKIEREAASQKPFEMRAGIHTGNVVAGIVGVKKFQYDIWGDTVNTASRMESSGEVGKVNISQATYELIKDDPNFTFQNRGKIEAKGKGEIEMYFVSLK